jgi:hypothetical protein
MLVFILIAGAGSSLANSLEKTHRLDAVTNLAERASKNPYSTRWHAVLAWQH